MITKLTEPQLRKRISKNLRTLLDVRALSQADLARLLHGQKARSHRNTISLWCAGKRSIPTSQLLNVCKILDCQLADLLE